MPHDLLLIEREEFALVAVAIDENNHRSAIIASLPAVALLTGLHHDLQFTHLKCGPFSRYESRVLNYYDREHLVSSHEFEHVHRRFKKGYRLRMGR